MGFKGEQALKVIERLLDKNDRLEAKTKRLESRNDGLVGELRKCLEGLSRSFEKKAESA